MEHLSNSKELFRTLVGHVALPESKEEIESIVLLLLEKRCDLTRAEVLAGKETSIRISELLNDVRRINSHEPVQYILEAADFFGREFMVDPSVLIPRPETETLVAETLKFIRKSHSERVLDIGTGSGCIAITIAMESSSVVLAIDVSREALATARSNADRLSADVSFIQHDFLLGDKLPGSWDVIVSNPPYVRKAEADQMKLNVTGYEPHLALFVPDNDPLIFYRAIAEYGKVSLNPGGAIFVELNESLGDETSALFSQAGYESVLIKDLAGKDRIIKAILK